MATQVTMREKSTLLRFPPNQLKGSSMAEPARNSQSRGLVALLPYRTPQISLPKLEQWLKCSTERQQNFLFLLLSVSRTMDYL